MIISWFSCGVTSAVATKLAIRDYGNIEIYYIQIDSAHPDNKRFIEECEEWYGQKINIVVNKKGYADQFDVIKKTKYINGPYGARCTLELKKQVRMDLERDLKPDAQVFGFEFSKREINRAIRFKEQYDVNPIYPLIDNKLSKNECHGILQKAGIKQPKMYDLGYPNNNCIGCVKGRVGYWNKIRDDFPDYFERMAKMEREIGASCVNGIYLDEMPEDAGRKMQPVVPDCGIFCQVEFEDIISPDVDKIMNQ